MLRCSPCSVDQTTLTCTSPTHDPSSSSSTTKDQRHTSRSAGMCLLPASARSLAAALQAGVLAHHVKVVRLPCCLVVDSTRLHHQLSPAGVTIDDPIGGLALHGVKRPEGGITNRSEWNSCGFHDGLSITCCSSHPGENRILGLFQPRICRGSNPDLLCRKTKILG